VAQAGLFSPELQIVHEVTAVTASNELFSRVCNGYGGNCSTGTLTVPSATDGNSRAYHPVAAVDAIPAIAAVNSNNPPPTVDQDMALINFFNTRMMGGTMSGPDIAGSFNCLQSTPDSMKWYLMNALRCTGGINEVLNGGTNGTTGGDQAARERRKALYLMHLIAISPEYSTQR
jgi:hypothetical protein